MHSALIDTVYGFRTQNNTRVPTVQKYDAPQVDATAVECVDIKKTEPSFHSKQLLLLVAAFDKGRKRVHFGFLTYRCPECYGIRFWKVTPALPYVRTYEIG